MTTSSARQVDPEFFQDGRPEVMPAALMVEAVNFDQQRPRLLFDVSPQQFGRDIAIQASDVVLLYDRRRKRWSVDRIERATQGCVPMQARPRLNIEIACQGNDCD